MKTRIGISMDNKVRGFLDIFPETPEEEKLAELFREYTQESIGINIFSKDKDKEEAEEKVNHRSLPTADKFIFAGVEWINNHGEKPIIRSKFDVLTVNAYLGGEEYTPRTFRENLVESVNWKNIIGYCVPI